MERTSSRERLVAQLRDRPLHPLILETIDRLPTKLQDMRSTVIHGPPGSGKYSIALAIAGGFSPSALRYEKKMVVECDGKSQPHDFSLPMSDVHFEVDMGVSHCGSRTGWGQVHRSIVEAVQIRREKSAIVLCRGVDAADSDLLSTLESFMRPTSGGVDLRYILVTDHLGVLPQSLRARCTIIAVPRPARSVNLRVRGRVMPEEEIEVMSARGALAALCDSPAPSLYGLRDAVYAGLTRNMDLSKWSWHMMREWGMRAGAVDVELESQAFDALLTFARGHAASYRPIFHLERLALSLGALLRWKCMKPPQS